MALQCGIVGLPNVGVITVPDDRLVKLEELVHPQRVQPTTVEIVDIAGLVKGASKGEGLGNKFLANIRETDEKRIEKSFGLCYNESYPLEEDRQHDAYRTVDLAPHGVVSATTEYHIQRIFGSQPRQFHRGRVPKNLRFSKENYPR